MRYVSGEGGRGQENKGLVEQTTKERKNEGGGIGWEREMKDKVSADEDEG